MSGRPGRQCVKTWEGTRRDERRFKNRKNTPDYCPICNGQAERQWKERGVIINSRGRQYSIHTLPRWAQETITSLIAQREDLQKALKHLHRELANNNEIIASYHDDEARRLEEVIRLEIELAAA